MLLFSREGFSTGGLCPPYKINGGILSTYANFSRGDYIQGGFCPTLGKWSRALSVKWKKSWLSVEKYKKQG